MDLWAGSTVEQHGSVGWEHSRAAWICGLKILTIHNVADRFRGVSGDDEEENDEERLSIMNDLNIFLEEIEKKYQDA